MDDWKDAWRVWAAVTLVSVPAAALFWFVAGTAACGEELYDTPPGSLGDDFCTTVVQPVVPWIAVAGIPVLVPALGGVVAMQIRSRRLFVAALAAPFVLVTAGTVVALAFS